MLDLVSKYVIHLWSKANGRKRLWGHKRLNWNNPKLWHDFTIQTWKYHYDSSGGDGLYCVGINNNRSDNKAETNPSIQSGSSWQSLNKERYFTNSTNTTTSSEWSMRGIQRACARNTRWRNVTQPIRLVNLRTRTRPLMESVCGGRGSGVSESRPHK